MQRFSDVQLHKAIEPKLNQLLWGTDIYAILSNGEVMAWGSKGSFDVDGAKNTISVASNIGHTLALQADGTVIVWGDNEYGQCDIPRI